MHLLFAACTSAPIDTADPADSGVDTGAADTADPFPSVAVAGTETYECAFWLTAQEARNCVQEWTIAGHTVEPCEGCTAAYQLTLDYEADRSTDDGTCTTQAVDRAMILAFTEAFEDKGPSVIRHGEGAWYWWSYGEVLEDGGLHWYFGWQDEYVANPNEPKDSGNLYWYTNWWEATLHPA